MEFVKRISDKIGARTGYALAKYLSVKFSKHYSPQQCTNWLGEQEGMNLADLCRLREISGQSWEQFGADLDREFLHKQG